MRLSATRSRTAAVAAVVAGLLLVPAAAGAAWTPDFEAPFLCKQDWRAETRQGHSPSYFAVDFNRDDDFRAPVRAAAPGRVTKVVNLGDDSYGKYIVISHGNGWESLYAHLDAQLVVPGQRVDQGALIGLLGTSGGSTGPHLHFEQKLNGTVKHAVFHGKSLVYNTTITSNNCADVPLTGDWNGNGRTDVGVFRPRSKTNVFRMRLPSGDVRTIPLGKPGDLPLTGDWDGDDRTDVGVWRRMTQTFCLRMADGNQRVFAFGKLREIPVTGDWNGDGRTDVGVFSPGSKQFRLRSAGGHVTTVDFGSVGSVPVAGDWNGDGRDEVGVFDSATRTWTLRGTKGGVRTQTFGGVGGMPVIGDWNGDGSDGLGTWGPLKAVFQLKTKGSSTKISFGRPRR